MDTFFVLRLQMFIQLQLQNLAILKLELELLAVEVRVVLVDNPVVIGADDNDIRRIVVLRTSEVINMMSFNNAVAILVANLLAADLVAIVARNAGTGTCFTLSVLLIVLLYFNQITKILKIFPVTRLRQFIK